MKNATNKLKMNQRKNGSEAISVQLEIHKFFMRCLEVQTVQTLIFVGVLHRIVWTYHHILWFLFTLLLLDDIPDAAQPGCLTSKSKGPKSEVPKTKGTAKNPNKGARIPPN